MREIFCYNFIEKILYVSGFTFSSPCILWTLQFGLLIIHTPDWKLWWCTTFPLLLFECCVLAFRTFCSVKIISNSFHWLFFWFIEFSSPTFLFVFKIPIFCQSFSSMVLIFGDNPSSDFFNLSVTIFPFWVLDCIYLPVCVGQIQTSLWGSDLFFLVNDWSLLAFCLF